MGQTAIAEKLCCENCNSAPDEKQITAEIKNKHTPKKQESKPILKESVSNSRDNALTKLEQKNDLNPSENEIIKSQSHNESDHAPNQNSMAIDNDIADKEILNETQYDNTRQEEENDDGEIKNDADATEEKLEANDVITNQQNIANSRKKNKWRTKVKTKKGTKAAEAAEAFEYAAAKRKRKRKPTRKPMKKATDRPSKAVKAAQAFEAAEAAKAAKETKGKLRPTKIATQSEAETVGVPASDRDEATSRTMLKKSIFLKRGTSKMKSTMKLTRDTSWVKHESIESPKSAKYEFDSFMLNRKVSKLGKNLLAKYDSGKNVHVLVNINEDSSSSVVTSDEEF